MTGPTDLPTEVIRLADLRNRTATPFDLTPTERQRAAIAAHLDITAVRKLTFQGRIAPLGARDWELTGLLGATVVQPCVATLAPVTSRLDEEVRRVYAHDFAEPDGTEVEMPEDDAVEPLPQTLDLGAVMIEALSLALPAFPRAPGAELGQVLAAGAGIAPMTDYDAKPFAGLGALRDRLTGEDGTDS